MQIHVLLVDMDPDSYPHTSMYLLYLNANNPTLTITVTYQSQSNRQYPDTDYTTANSCSGHDPNGQKAWLQGYYFEDKTIDPTLLTNAQLTDLLNPSMGETYQQLIPYVYDKTLIGCPSVDNLLVS